MGRTTITRISEKASSDRAALNRLLDGEIVAHVGLVRPDGWPVVMPTALARDGDRILIHGSTGSPWIRRLAEGAPACVEVTAVDGLVVARSAFESSIRYRSAVLFGTFAVATDREQALAILTERLISGRTQEVRASTPKEYAATLILTMPISEWSLKISDGWPDDPDDDVAGNAWAGVVPIERRTYGSPLPAPDLRPGIAVPKSVAALSRSVTDERQQSN